MKCPACQIDPEAVKNLVTVCETVLTAHRDELEHGGRVYTDETALIDALEKLPGKDLTHT